EDVRAFFHGEAPLSAAMRAEDGPVWHRAFGLEPDAAACAELERALAHVHATRMVVGHTVQREGINAACDERVWRIDVGLAEHYGGPTEVLELTGDTARVLRATP
ncbi:MAG: calcineurin, partial [Myxococcota bacterium]|nr:calcineurin [Myxococcota bacterium]